MKERMRLCERERERKTGIMRLNPNIKKTGNMIKGKIKSVFLLSTKGICRTSVSEFNFSSGNLFAFSQTE